MTDKKLLPIEERAKEIYEKLLTPWKEGDFLTLTQQEIMISNDIDIIRSYGEEEYRRGIEDAAKEVDNLEGK